ncbi:MAG TPA: hypothetical protein VG101_09785 [Puia sp.]|jgi:hypothetical protein|nr:hypothetical protein [Puia sp.]
MQILKYIWLNNMHLPVKNIVSEIDLKPADALLPLFETVVNSIHSLKLTKAIKPEEKKIQVQLFREGYPPGLQLSDVKMISSIKVYDNGEGFNDSNLESFKTAYSRKNKDLGCKGIGRFTVLAAFKSMRIQSNFRQNNAYGYREIEFDLDNEVGIVKDEPSQDKKNQTVVELTSCYNDIVRQHSALDARQIAEQLMNHCLVYYLCNDLPLIEIYDKEKKEVCTVNELFNNLSKDREKDFMVGGHSFKCYITKSPRTSNRKYHYIYYCANSRVVGYGKSIAKVNSIFAYSIIENGEPRYLDVYVVSDFLNKKVYAARNGFAIPQEKETNLFSEVSGELCFDEIELAIAKQLEEEYDEFVKVTQDRNIRELKQYIETKAPRYKRFLGRPDILKSIPPNLSEDKKEELLYKISFTEKKTIDAKIQRFIDIKNINEDTIEEVKQELKDKTAYDADCLSDYMLRRRAILDIFRKFLDADQNGLYKLEEDIHNLIFPLGVTMDAIDYESHNLWLLDERFSTYSFIASDTPITQFSQKNSRREPDITMTDKPTMFDNPISFGNISSGEISSMVIFEFKRPGEVAHQKKKNDFRWSFAELIEKYFDDFLYADNKKNYKGRQVIVHKETPKFGYVVVDVIPPRLKEYNLGKGYKQTPFGTLYKIEPEMNLHIEVITFQQLIDAVEKRHAPFFEKLFNPIAF